MPREEAITAKKLLWLKNCISYDNKYMGEEDTYALAGALLSGDIFELQCVLSPVGHYIVDKKWRQWALSTLTQ